MVPATNQKMKQTNITITKLIEKLEDLGVDEVTLLEVLEISSEDIIERFRDRIEEKRTTLIRDFFDNEQEDIDA